MSEVASDRLLAGLNAGDPQAAAEAFVTFEPYLRMVIRRHVTHAVRAKFDSADVVQSVWADVVDGLRRLNWTFRERDQLRAFLVKMTRNRFIDRLRKQRAEIEHEVRFDPQQVESLAVSAASRASEEFYAAELWDQMLDACPPAHCRVLELKRQGASLSEIATHTGLHKSSVRRILYDVSRLVVRLRTRGDCQGQ
jgi:RNA polymerase sigma-70 factor (ECF subfamily)